MPRKGWGRMRTEEPPPPRFIATRVTLTAVEASRASNHVVVGVTKRAGEFFYLNERECEEFVDGDKVSYFLKCVPTVYVHCTIQNAVRGTVSSGQQARTRSSFLVYSILLK